MLKAEFGNVILAAVVPFKVVKERLLPPTFAVVEIFVIPVPLPIFVLAIFLSLPADPEFVQTLVEVS